jgi:hypothetical protein
MFTRKSSTPIDRAVADIERQIADLERRVQQAESPSTGQSPSRGAWKEWFAPPARRAAVARRQPPEITVEPLKELERAPLPFAREPDLFHRVVDRPAGTARRRSPLRWSRRENRRRFYLWIVLGMVVLGLLWLVVH